MAPRVDWTKKPKPKIVRPAKPKRIRIGVDDIVGALQHGPATVDQLAEQLPICRALVHRLLIELERRGKVRRETAWPRVVATTAGRVALSGKMRRSTKTYPALVALVDAGTDGLQVERITDGPIATLRRLGYAEATEPQGTRRAEVWSLVDADEAEAPTKLAA